MKLAPRESVPPKSTGGVLCTGAYGGPGKIGLIVYPRHATSITKSAFSRSSSSCASADFTGHIAASAAISPVCVSTCRRSKAFAAMTLLLARITGLPLARGRMVATSIDVSAESDRVLEAPAARRAEASALVRGGGARGAPPPVEKGGPAAPEVEILKTWVPSVFRL